jgi:hypothetical protein
VPRFRIQLISEPVSATDFEDPRTLRELSDSIVRDGYCTFEGRAGRLGSASQGISRQTIFVANIARITEM